MCFPLQKQSLVAWERRAHLLLAADLRHDLLLLDLGLALLGAIGGLEFLLELTELLRALADLLDQLLIAKLLNLAAVELSSDPLLLLFEGLLAEVLAVLLRITGGRVGSEGGREGRVEGRVFAPQ